MTNSELKMYFAAHLPLITCAWVSVFLASLILQKIDITLLYNVGRILKHKSHMLHRWTEFYCCLSLHWCWIGISNPINMSWASCYIRHLCDIYHSKMYYYLRGQLYFSSNLGELTLMLITINETSILSSKHLIDWLRKITMNYWIWVHIGRVLTISGLAANLEQV